MNKKLYKLLQRPQAAQDKRGGVKEETATSIYILFSFRYSFAPIYAAYPAFAGESL